MQCGRDLQRNSITSLVLKIVELHNYESLQCPAARITSEHICISYVHAGLIIMPNVFHDSRVMHWLQTEPGEKCLQRISGRHSGGLGASWGMWVHVPKPKTFSSGLKSHTYCTYVSCKQHPAHTLTHDFKTVCFLFHHVCQSTFSCLSGRMNLLTSRFGGEKDSQTPEWCKCCCFQFS